MDKNLYNANLLEIREKESERIEYILRKKSDDIFGGMHPNGIDPGYTVIGNFEKPPTVGERFVITGRGIRRYLNTSPVSEIISGTEFKTENSTYELLPYNPN